MMRYLSKSDEELLTSIERRLVEVTPSRIYDPSPCVVAKAIRRLISLRLLVEGSAGWQVDPVRLQELTRGEND